MPVMCKIAAIVVKSHHSKQEVGGSGDKGNINSPPPPLHCLSFYLFHYSYVLIFSYSWCLCTSLVAPFRSCQNTFWYVDSNSGHVAMPYASLSFVKTCSQYIFTCWGWIIQSSSIVHLPFLEVDSQWSSSNLISPMLILLSLIYPSLVIVPFHVLLGLPTCLLSIVQAIAIFYVSLNSVSFKPWATYSLNTDGHKW